MKQIYEHIGASHFDKSLFMPIRKHFPTKPRGGFWASPCGDEFYTWKDWSKDNYCDVDDQDHFFFTLKDEAKVFRITSQKEYEEFVNRFGKIQEEMFGLTKVTFDWKQVAEVLDAVEVDVSSWMKLYDLMYSWDCDSICIFNPDIVEEIS